MLLFANRDHRQPIHYAFNSKNTAGGDGGCRKHYSYVSLNIYYHRNVYVFIHLQCVCALLFQNITTVEEYQADREPKYIQL
jgi:hypothetical protein